MYHSEQQLAANIYVTICLRTSVMENFLTQRVNTGFIHLIKVQENVVFKLSCGFKSWLWSLKLVWMCTHGQRLSSWRLSMIQLKLNPRKCQHQVFITAGNAWINYLSVKLMLHLLEASNNRDHVHACQNHIKIEHDMCLSRKTSPVC